jgi:CTP synthase
MQMAVIEFARNVLGMASAHSTEMDPDTTHAVINMMEEQKKISMMGGTMRLGSYPCSIQENTLAHNIYGETLIHERHRHRYEFNNRYRPLLEKKGMVIAGVNKDRDLVEIIEVPNHPWFVAVQFHPEFKSKPLAPHPLFSSFIAAALSLRSGRSKTPAKTKAKGTSRKGAAKGSRSAQLGV